MGGNSWSGGDHARVMFELRNSNQPLHLVARYCQHLTSY
jgi:hypothetical protein